MRRLRGTGKSGGDGEPEHDPKDQKLGERPSRSARPTADGSSLGTSTDIYRGNAPYHGKGAF